MKVISILATTVLIVGSFILISLNRDTIAQLWTSLREDAQTVFVGSHSFNVTIADTPEARRQGLSGTEQLPDFTGKLFVFDTDAAHGIWMKDMNYAIDILWFGSDRRLLHIEENVTPDTYTRNRTIFRPSEPARYVLEVNAGTVDLLDIRRNEKLTLPPDIVE